MEIMGKKVVEVKRQNTRLLLFRYKKNNVNIINKFSDKTIEEKVKFYEYANKKKDVEHTEHTL